MYRHSLVLMVEPQNDDNMHSMSLTHGTFWVQLHGVPGFYMTMVVAQAILVLC